MADTLYLDGAWSAFIREAWRKVVIPERAIELIEDFRLHLSDDSDYQTGWIGGISKRTRKRAVIGFEFSGSGASDNNSAVNGIAVYLQILVDQCLKKFESEPSPNDPSLQEAQC